MPPEPADPSALLEPTLATIRDALRSVAPTLDYHYWRSPIGLDAPRLDVCFHVATEAEMLACRRHDLGARLDEETRRQLARNGYLRRTGDVILVALRSREALERGDWR